MLKKISGIAIPSILQQSFVSVGNIFIQSYYFYQNLTKPSEELILSYSLSTLEGKALRPSYLISVITDMFKNKEKLNYQVPKENIYTKKSELK